MVLGRIVDIIKMNLKTAVKLILNTDIKAQDKNRIQEYKMKFLRSRFGITKRDKIGKTIRELEEQPVLNRDLD